MAWTLLNGGDHGGDDWTVANGTYINGLHYNINKFVIMPGTVVYQQGMTEGESYAGSGSLLEIRANEVYIWGWLAAYAAGYWGGHAGYPNGQGSGGAVGVTTASKGGGAGYAYNGHDGVGTGTTGGSAYGTFADADINFGSGGGSVGNNTAIEIGAGGRGGGCIIIRADYMRVGGVGAIAADGEPGLESHTSGGIGTGHYGGGGSGGGILIYAGKLLMDSGGIIRALGGWPAGSWGAGSMGRVKTFTIEPVQGGGEIVYNDGTPWTNGGGGDHGGNDWILTTDGTYINGLHYNVRNFRIAQGVTVLQYGMTAQDSTNGLGMKLEIRARNIKIAGQLAAYASGYLGGRAGHVNGDGIGEGDGVTSYSGGGGGYGSVGTPGHIYYAPNSSGGMYGFSANNLDIYHGSGGGATGTGSEEGTTGRGGQGGGCIILRAETIEITSTGSITANGSRGNAYNGYRGGGGSGGGILLTCRDLVLNGNISANGAAGEYYTYGGTGYYGGSGGAGTVRTCTYNTRTGSGTISTLNGQATAQSAVYTTVLGECQGGIHFGYIFTINSGLSVAMESIKLLARQVITPCTLRFTIYASTDRTITLGTGTVAVTAAGDVACTMYKNGVPFIKLEPYTQYYLEVTVISASGNVRFSMCRDDSGQVHHIRMGTDPVAGAIPYIQYIGYGHVTNAILSNAAHPTLKENLAACLLVGADVEINADGTGAYHYHDAFNTRKAHADSYIFTNVTHTLTGEGYITFTNEAELVYKVPTYYPIRGTPVLTLNMLISTGTPRIQVGLDPGYNGGEPAEWYDIDDEITTGEAIYNLESSDNGVSFDGETVMWFRITTDMMTTISVLDMILNMNLDTSDAQLLEIDKGLNTMLFEQEGGVYPNAAIEFKFRERKLGA